MSDIQVQPITHGKKRTASDASLADPQLRVRPTSVTPGDTVIPANASGQISKEILGSPMEGVQLTIPSATPIVTALDRHDVLDKAGPSNNYTPTIRLKIIGPSANKVRNRQDTPLQDGPSSPLPELTDSERKAMAEIDGSRDDGDEDSDNTIVTTPVKPSRAAKIQANDRIDQNLGFTSLNKAQGKINGNGSGQSTVSDNENETSTDADYQPPASSLQTEAPKTPNNSPLAARGPNSASWSNGGRKNSSSVKAQKKDRNPAHDEANIHIYTLRQQGKDFDSIASEMNRIFPTSNDGRVWTRAACDGRFRRNGQFVASERGEKWNRDWYMHMKEPISQEKIKPVYKMAVDEKRGETSRGVGEATTEDEGESDDQGGASLHSRAEKDRVAVLLGLLGAKIDEEVREEFSRRTGVERSVQELKAMLVELTSSKE